MSNEQDKAEQLSETLHIPVTSALLASIEAMARDDHRSTSQMARVLLIEAAEARAGDGGMGGAK
jgi:hypothetical protein